MFIDYNYNVIFKKALHYISAFTTYVEMYKWLSGTHFGATLICKLNNMHNRLFPKGRLFNASLAYIANEVVKRSTM